MQSFSQFLKNFSLVTLSQLHFISQLEMQVCSVILPTAFIFYCISGVIISFQNALKHAQNRTKLRIKWPKIVCGWGSATDPAGGAYLIFSSKDTGAPYVVPNKPGHPSRASESIITCSMMVSCGTHLSYVHVLLFRSLSVLDFHSIFC